MQNEGKIIRIVGPVIDIFFEIDVDNALTPKLL